MQLIYIKSKVLLSLILLLGLNLILFTLGSTSIRAAGNITQNLPISDKTNFKLNATQAVVNSTYGNILPDFYNVWKQSDLAVANGQSKSSWLWGPDAFATKTEDYKEAPGGKRQVQYFDKARMEVNNPNGDRTSLYFVTNGLLPKELISGQMQVGDNSFIKKSPAEVNVAGDAGGSVTYAKLASVTTLEIGKNVASNHVGQPVTAAIDRTGNVSQHEALPGVQLATYIPETQHNIPNVFWNYFKTLPQDWLFVMGYPLSEPYITEISLAGKPTIAMVQVFERRVLTYTPSNPDAYKVEQGNVGRHYFQWRFASNPSPKTPARITFWYGLSGSLGSTVEELVTLYNHSQNIYTVDAIQQTNYDETINRYNAALAGGSLPNLVQVYDIGLQRMIDTKRIIPMQNLIERDNLDIIGDFEPMVKSYYTIGNRLYSMPFNSSVPVMYFNKKAFREVGLDPEKRVWTYDELIDAARKLTKKTGSNTIRYGVGFTSYSWIFEQEVATQDKLFAEPNNGREARATNLVFNNQAGENWLNLIKSLSNEGTAIYYGNETYNGGIRDNDFISGQTSIVFNTSAALRNFLNRSGSSTELGVAYLPKPNDAKGGVIIGGASLWITDQGTTAQQEAAWDFVKWLSQPQIQAYWSSHTGYYPVVKSAYNQKEMQDFMAQVPQFGVIIDQLRTTPPGFATQGAVFGSFTQTRPIIESAIDDFIIGRETSAKAALNSAAKKANNILQQYNTTIK